MIPFEKCRGCPSLNYLQFIGRFYCLSLVFQEIIINVIDCPCQKCLIKVMCTRACDKFYSLNPLGVTNKEEMMHPFLKRKQ